MVLRRERDDAVLAIGQPAHAWISGQLARAWGNERFGEVQPREEVCLSAEQHDIGMAAWDLAPTLNLETGLPHSFIEMPLAVHLELWSAAASRLLRQSRYAALLVAMHGRRLYEMRDLSRFQAPEVDAVRGFLARQRQFEQALLRALRDDPITAPSASDELVVRNSQLLWIWDFLSLALCLDWAPTSARAVPSAGEPVDLRLETGGAPGRMTFDPWPFSAEPVKVRCEGQRLRQRFEDEEEMRRALAGAAWETIELELVPA